MEYTNYNTVPSVTSLNDTDTLHITTGGTHRQATVATLIAKAKAQTQTAIEAALLDKLTEGCYIMYHRKVDNYPMLATASQWTALQSAGEVADGVLIIDGGHTLLVAPTEAPNALQWSSQGVLVGAAIADRKEAMEDFTGRARTAAILADATIGGDGSGYASGFCAAYSRTNGMTYTGDQASLNNKGMKAGLWWLPSYGELYMIYSNKLKVNTLLQLIDGGATLANKTHWASTELGATNSYHADLGSGAGGNGSKTGIGRNVRPVSAFYY